jgi:hypothetical protein
LKIKPSRFKLFERMQQVFVHEGLVAFINNQCDLRAGDTVYLWQSEPGRGLCGVATVMAESAPRERFEWQKEHDLVEPYASDASRVLLEVQRVAPLAPMGRESFRSYGGTTQACDSELVANFETFAAHFKTAEQLTQQPISAASDASAVEH